jgi:hypothetical protein
VEDVSRKRVDRSAAATREFIRQMTTHLTQNKNAEIEKNTHGRKRVNEITVGDAVIESILQKSE